MFPGATADRDAADYVVVGAPLDVSTSFRPGTRFGPARVREAARPFDDYDHYTGRHFSDCAVHDHGDVRAWDDAAEYLDYLDGVCTDVVWDDAVPCLIGGEHTVSLAGIRATDPDVVVSLDAHLDLKTEYDGNPLSHATVLRHALDVADEVVVAGARAGSEDEWDRADRDDVTVVTPDEVAAARRGDEGVAGADWCPDATGDSDVYLTLDVDAADPGFAPGTGTPEPFGLAPRDLRDVVQAVAPGAVGVDVVEVNDRDDGQAAALAAKCLRRFVFSHAADRD